MLRPFPRRFGHLRIIGSTKLFSTFIFTVITGKCVFKQRSKQASSRSSTTSTSSSTNSRLSTKFFKQIVEKLRLERHRDSTRNNYYCIWKHFNKFFIRLDIRPKEWEDQLVLFIAHLINEKKQSSTVKSYISVIRATLADLNISLNENQFLLTSLTQACRLKNDKIRHRFPIYKELLQVILKYVELYCMQQNQPYLCHLYQAILVTARYGLFRGGEVTMSNHCIKARDVHTGFNKKKMMFVLRSSETHNEGDRPQMVKISGGNDINPAQKYCPLWLLCIYIESRPGYLTINEQFFVFRDRSLVKPAHMRFILKKSLQLANFNDKLYSFHMLRAGRAGDLLKQGVPVESIRKIGCWRSNAIYNYLK